MHTGTKQAPSTKATVTTVMIPTTLSFEGMTKPKITKVIRGDMKHCVFIDLTSSARELSECMGTIDAPKKKPEIRANGTARIHLSITTMLLS